MKPQLVLMVYRSCPFVVIPYSNLLHPCYAALLGNVYFGLDRIYFAVRDLIIIAKRDQNLQERTNVITNDIIAMNKTDSS